MTSKQIISALILVILIAWLVYYGYNHRGDFAELATILAITKELNN